MDNSMPSSLVISCKESRDWPRHSGGETHKQGIDSVVLGTHNVWQVVDAQ